MRNNTTYIAMFVLTVYQNNNNLKRAPARVWRVQNIMKKGIFYLNNSGSKWVVFGSDGKREKITLQTKGGKLVQRSVNYYSSFGNFATANISWKGKKIDVFPDTLLDD